MNNGRPLVTTTIFHCIQTSQLSGSILTIANRTETTIKSLIRNSEIKWYNLSIFVFDIFHKKVYFLKKSV